MSTLTSRAISLNFMDMMKQYLSALREVYPECARVVAYDVAFTLQTSGKTAEQMEVLGDEAMQEYHAIMAPWYSRCTRRDETLLDEDIEFLTNLDSLLRRRSPENLQIGIYSNEINSGEPAFHPPVYCISAGSPNTHDLQYG